MVNGARPVLWEERERVRSIRIEICRSGVSILLQPYAKHSSSIVSRESVEIDIQRLSSFRLLAVAAFPG